MNLPLTKLGEKIPTERSAWPRMRAGASHAMGPLPATLAMTEYGFVFGMLLIVFWAIDPGKAFLDQIPVVKHFPVVVLLASVVLAAFGVWINKNKGKLPVYTIAALVGDFKYLLLFSLFVVVGSLVAKYLREINETFLTMGVFSLAAPMTAWVILNSSVPERVVKLVSYDYMIAALIAAGVALAKFGSGEVFHNREHLVIPVIGVALFFIRGVTSKIIAIAVIAVLAASGGKNTAYITALVTVVLLLLTRISALLAKQANPLKSALTKMIVLCVAMAAGVVFWLVYQRINSLLPTGNPEYRLHMYELAFNKFLESPVWGDAFSESAVTHFDLFQVAVSTQNLPTHSDPLDILANGGATGFCLWMLALLSAIWPAWKAGRTKLSRQSGAFMRAFYVFLFVSMTGILVSLFNPLLNLPNQAFAFWAAVGALVACIRLSRAPD